MFIKLLIVGIFFAFLIGGLIGYKIHKKSVSIKIKNLKYYEKTYLSKSGYSQGYGNYQLRSFDGGLNWYAVDIDMSNGSVTVKGLAEEISPGLLAHLEGLDKLTEYVKKNGTITLNGNRAKEEIDVLTAAGFTVELK